jgi:CDP-paratose 2-epimerase
MKHQDHTSAQLGILEWLRPGEHERVEQLLADLRSLGITHLRTGVSWADYLTPEGRDWYHWLLPYLAQSVEVLPCFHYTPPSLGVVPKTASPPRCLKDYADFIDVMITDFGQYFEWVELWNEPNNLNDWDWRIDPSWQNFCEMVIGAAYWAQHRGKKTVLGGMAPVDLNWLRMIGERGVLQHIDAVGIHGFPGTWEFDWDDWSITVEQVRSQLARHQSQAEIWITETGFSTWQHDQRTQIDYFLKAIHAPVERVYWYSLHDLHPSLPTQEGFHTDERHYHMGLTTAQGSPKLLYRLWSDAGTKGLNQVMQTTAVPPLWTVDERPALITGGAGFVGTNLANRLLSEGQSVLLLDNLSRPGVEHNWHWLKQKYGHRVQLELADVRDRYTLQRLVPQVAQIYHLAAQVAVTTSLANPTEDFAVNVQGTMNLLEALRHLDTPPPLVFTSTNKVYGGLEHVELVEECDRYQPRDSQLRTYGVSEQQPLHFHSPYGCSKGTADQYILDYARSYGLPAVVFRMSCIYGPHQCGTEDQGWVAHFLKQVLNRQDITLFGTGKQVRDILFVEDLVDAFQLAQAYMPRLSGQAFNIGGSPSNSTSLLNLLDEIRHLHRQPISVQLDDWRPSDQRYYVSDIRRFSAATGWQPKFSIHRGLACLYDWLKSQQTATSKLLVNAHSR